jgi:hypothetical protein
VLPGDKRGGRKKGLNVLHTKTRESRAKAIDAAKLCIAFAGTTPDNKIVMYILNTRRELFTVTFKVKLHNTQFKYIKSYRITMHFSNKIHLDGPAHVPLVVRNRASYAII